jgi:phosphoglycolate phosphatase-like HAD superfamily hydrolase
MTEQLRIEQPVVIVDIDGVLFDTPKQAVERWNAIHGTAHDVTDIYDHDAVHDKEKFRHYHEDGKYDEGDDKGKFDDGFYDGQKEVEGYLQMPGARDALHRLRLSGAKIIALTSRDPSKLRDETMTAIDVHFGIGDDEDHLIDKVLFAGDPDTGRHRKKSEIIIDEGGHVLVDDAVRYVTDAAEHGLPAILLTQPYNKTGHNWPPENTAADWNEAELLIERELQKRKA